MGEVYRARDTRLGRDVAIKVLPALFAHDDERMQRFEREARTLAALNHPNIAQVHGLEDLPAGAGGGLTMANYSVTPDGNNFLMIKDQPRAILNVVLNWLDEVKAAVK